MPAKQYQIALDPSSEPGIPTLRTALADALQPPPELTISEWADERRKLPRVSSSEHGQWRTERFPFLRQIMDDLSPQSPHQQVVVMKGAQLGFTEVAMNMMLYNVDYHPCPMLYVQRTIGAIEKFSKQRFTPSVEVMPTVQEKLGNAKGRDSSNTMLLKSWPGGICILGGANSAARVKATRLSWPSAALPTSRAGRCSTSARQSSRRRAASSPPSKRELKATTKFRARSVVSSNPSRGSKSNSSTMMNIACASGGWSACTATSKSRSGTRRGC